MKIMQAITKPFVVFVEKYYPDPFVFSILLSLLTLFIALGITDSTPTQALDAWGNGLSGLLTFMAQICIMLIAAHALALTDPVQKALIWLAQKPSTVRQCYMMVVLVAGISALFSWALAILTGALISKQIAIEGQKKGLKLHYPLLVASGYAAFVIWHMGYSASAPLFVATPGNTMEATIGGLIPVSETIFAGWNIATALGTLALITLVCPLMHPGDKDVIEAPVDKFAAEEQTTPEALASKTLATKTLATKTLATKTLTTKTLANRLDHARLMTIILGGALSFYLISWFMDQGLNLTLNIVNWSLLALGLLMARSPVHYISLVTQSGKTITPILLQYPLYAGIMGMMADTGLVSVMSSCFTEIATQDTLPFWAFLSGGLVNFFVPSGGGQWVIQGPIFIEAAQNLGVDLPLIVMSVAYGDQWTNMVQPFWTIPLLAIAGLHIRQIMGYTFVIFILTFFTFGAGLYFAS